MIEWLVYALAELRRDWLVGLRVNEAVIVCDWLVGLRVNEAET